MGGVCRRMDKAGGWADVLWWVDRHVDRKTWTYWGRVCIGREGMAERVWQRGYDRDGMAERVGQRRYGREGMAKRYGSVVWKSCLFPRAQSSFRARS